MGFFDKNKETNSTTKILGAVIVGMLILNLLAFKSVLSIAENKTIVVEVPQFLESGKYKIGNTFASDNVHKMWARIWTEDIANFSYDNVRKRITSIFDYLAPETVYENKEKFFDFIKFVEKNYITQKFKITDFYVEDLDRGYKKVYILGKIYRKIGSKKDKLSGLTYVYEYITFVRNGQIFIKSLKTYLASATDPATKAKLRAAESVDYQSELVKGAIRGDVAKKISLKKLQEKKKEKKERKKAKEAEKEKLMRAFGDEDTIRKLDEKKAKEGGK